MTSLGRAIREPHRRIHWAGIETDMSKEPFVPANDGVSLGVGSFRIIPTVDFSLRDAMGFAVCSELRDRQNRDSSYSITDLHRGIA